MAFIHIVVEDITRSRTGFGMTWFQKQLEAVFGKNSKELGDHLDRCSFP
jgi:hypothetical protein